MADLNAKQIEQIAKIRKESKTAKNYLFADCLCSCAVEGGALGIGASMISNAFDNAGMAKKIEINANHELTTDAEKLTVAQTLRKLLQLSQCLDFLVQEVGLKLHQQMFLLSMKMNLQRKELLQ